MARRTIVVSLCAALAWGVGSTADESSESGVPAVSPPADSLAAFRPSRHRAERELEQALLALPSAESLAATHEMVSSRPHVAGSAGDLAVIEKLATSYERLGLEVERHEFWAYLPRPVEARLTIVAPERLELPLTERPVDGDPYVGHDGTDFGWNAYSAEGDVTAPVVYANYGRREDFERLRELGVEVEGKIVLARYGKIFRGHKALFASRAGAAGLVLYNDPEETAYVRGLMYPEGGWANDSYIQRGSILVLPYAGDPLTPFEPATLDAERRLPSSVDLPSIPVQPVGWGAAREIVSRMSGPPVPPDWQGALPHNYRLSGGDELLLHLRVDQEAGLTRTANVVGTLRGARYPDQLVVVGSHHDAWSFGAGDPNAGTIVVYELARAFAELARRGWRPDRSLVFANWGAEEFGIIGSVEWVEAHRAALEAGAVAYINLDGAAMGPDFAASAAPLLKQLVLDVAAAVPAATGEGSLLEAWRQGSATEGGEPRIGDLGGGSDHVGFYCHVGVPSAGLSARGTPGVSYHSNYETLAWYRQVVGDAYEPAILLSRAVGLMMARLANADLLPFSFERYGSDLARHARDLLERTSTDEAERIESLVERAEGFGERAGRLRSRLLGRLVEESLDRARLDRLNSVLLGLERVWIDPNGLPGRPWFRNLFAATDEDAGYSAWMLPRLRWAVERGESIEAAVRSYGRVLDALEEKMNRIEEILASTGDDG